MNGLTENVGGDEKPRVASDGMKLANGLFLVTRHRAARVRALLVTLSYAQQHRGDFPRSA